MDLTDPSPTIQKAISDYATILKMIGDYHKTDQSYDLSQDQRQYLEHKKTESVQFKNWMIQQKNKYKNYEGYEKLDGLVGEINESFGLLITNKTLPSTNVQLNQLKQQINKVVMELLHWQNSLDQSA